MEAHFHEWLGLCLRWLHLIFGIAWIGNSFYFMWLDSNLEVAKSETDDDVEGRLWMVHSGGFYRVEKRLIKPGQLPKTLHWFKWEATFTLLTGLALLILTYYFSNGLYLIDASKTLISPMYAFFLSLSSIALSWLVYDALWKSKMGREFPKITSVVNFFSLTFLAFILCHYFSGRAAFIHVGAAMGTIMVANVWRHILPAQQQMILATQAGEIPNYDLGKKAKLRSTHNSYMTLPVLFLMISNHYSMVYSGDNNSLALMLLIFIGIAARHVMLTYIRGNMSWLALGLSAAGMAIIIVLTFPMQLGTHEKDFEPTSFTSVQNIINQRCVSCHSTSPADKSFGPSPGGVHFDNPQSIKVLAYRILARAVVSKTMPLANKTGITQDERDELGRWIEQGALLE